jgi:hypothetical protein
MAVSAVRRGPGIVLSGRLALGALGAGLAAGAVVAIAGEPQLLPIATNLGQP